ncbi:helix-turn-helix domain-containing protein [Niabella beijingensis]|uniref:helix-turn-helix domain-containing protein n=1 Tax=Niabella beijingensis TaxID=2872700 RepID=UPI001CC05BB7|nr:helix-turn-helix transcriptional regulator [Niabella beijingensis]MBZ4190978.1 AraC family transcriptional regulator [Niabella beijingensis]
MKSNNQYPLVRFNDLKTDSEINNHVIYRLLAGINHLDHPHTHDFFVFLLFEDGSGTHTIDFSDHPVRPFQIHMLFPHQVHGWDLGINTRCHKLIISRSLFETFSSSIQFAFSRYNRYPVIDLDPVIFKKIAAEFSLICKDLDTIPMFWDVISLRCSLIATLINRHVKSTSERTELRANSVLSRFHLLIEKHFQSHKSVSFYAEQLNVTPNYLTILCKKNFKESALSMIQQRVVLEAKRLMHSSELSIKEIAFELGFQEIAHFSFFFKSKTGLSPRQYRTWL